MSIVDALGALGYLFGSGSPNEAEMQRRYAELLAQQSPYSSAQQVTQPPWQGANIHGNRTTNTPLPLSPFSTGSTTSIGPNGITDAFTARAEASRKVPHEGVRAGEVIGWRYWIIDALSGTFYIRSVYGDQWWKPEEVVEEKGSFTVANGYGIHAYKEQTSLFDVLSPGSCIAVGTISMWGEVVEHENGWRSSKAKLRSIEWTVLDSHYLPTLREIYKV